MGCCKYCNKEYTNNVHVRWCAKNPSLENNKLRDSQKYSERAKKAWIDGKYKNANWNRNVKGSPHTEETKKLLSLLGRNSNHRRLVKSCRKYTTKEGKEVLLDSSWEEILAKRLDELDVKWERPEPIKWIDNTGKSRNYFPDFFLPEYNLYLDPKNKYAYESQKEKIKWLKTNVKNLVFLTNVDDIKNFAPIA